MKLKPMFIKFVAGITLMATAIPSAYAALTDHQTVTDGSVYQLGLAIFNW